MADFRSLDEMDASGSLIDTNDDFSALSIVIWTFGSIANMRVDSLQQLSGEITAVAALETADSPLIVYMI